MKISNLFWNLSFFLLGTLLFSNCGVTAAKPVEALPVIPAMVQMITPSLMPTEIIVNTPSPLPTQTLVPPSSTASRVEFPAESARLQIEVVDIEKPYQIYLSDDLIFAPGKGKMFLGLGIQVTNLTDSDIPLKWSDVYLINKYQDKWYPLWGAYKETNAVIDPLGIQIRQFKVDHKNQPEARIYLGDNGYLRAIFRVPRDNYYYYFSFADLPLIEIEYEDY